MAKDQNDQNDQKGQTRSKSKDGSDGASRPSGPDRRPANVAPDAVKDPNEKTDGKPGVPQKPDGGDVDPGAG